MGGRQLLDPRWHWMRDALQRLYAELEPGAQVGALNLVAINGSEMISYALTPAGPEIERSITTDAQAIADAVIAHSIDATIT